MPDTIQMKNVGHHKVVDDEKEGHEDRFDVLHGCEYSQTYSHLERVMKFLVFVLIPMLVVAFVISIVTFTRLNGDGGSTSEDSLIFGLSQYFPGLVHTDEGMAVRIGSGDCDSDTEYCDETDDSIFCEDKGALRTFTRQTGGDLFCVCDGYSWNCETTGKFCTTSPEAPRGAELEYGGCVNTASSETCSFTCSGALEPSGDYTCTDGEWDIQYCVCSEKGLESELNLLDIFGVSNTERCDHVMPGETCDDWTCSGDLRRVEGTELSCESTGWSINGDALCECQTERLHTALAMKRIDYVDIVGCEGTPAGELCHPYGWQCPPKLRQDGDLECNKKDGSWDVPDHPCKCDDSIDYLHDYSEEDIPGFKSSCGYLSVGESCDYHSWYCEHYLMPITALECTVDGLQGQCGCSVTELEIAMSPPSDDALIADCDKTPIGETCSDWTCRDNLQEKCCNSPKCLDDGHWEVHEDMCKGCDPADLFDYGPECGDGLKGPEDTCTIRCMSDDELLHPGEESLFQCEADEKGMVQQRCEATCLHDGWHVPCVCNPDTLEKNVPSAEFITYDEECGLADKCEVTCPEGLTVLEQIVCDPWKGFVGECVCPALTEIMNCPEPDCFPGYEPWACEDAEIGEVCKEYCTPILMPLVPYDEVSALVCTGESWSFFNSTPVADDSINQQMCGCDPCMALSNPEACIPVDIPLADRCTRDCPLECTDSLAFSGIGSSIVIECNVTTGAMCTAGDCYCGCRAGEINGNFRCPVVVEIGDTCDVNCRDGTIIHPICMDDGTWSETCGSCDPPPVFPQFASIDGSCDLWTIFPAPGGTQCPFECPCPLIASSDSFIECVLDLASGNASWTTQSCTCDTTTIHASSSNCVAEEINDLCFAQCEIGTPPQQTFTLPDIKCQLDGFSDVCGCEVADLELSGTNSVSCPTISNCTSPIAGSCVAAIAEVCSLTCTADNSTLSPTCKTDGTWDEFC